MNFGEVGPMAKPDAPQERGKSLSVVRADPLNHPARANRLKSFVSMGVQKTLDATGPFNELTP
jgi:hypothetical protein